MYQSFTLPKLASPVSCLLVRDTYGSHFCDKKLPSKCAQRLQGHEKALGASHENCELVVELNIDMPIVGTSSLEKQIDASVAGSLQGDKSSVNGCTSLKRRSQQDLEEARAEKRVKVESGVGLSCNSFNENGVDPTVPLRGVEGCQGTSLGDELTKENDELRPFVQGDENFTAVGNGVGNGTDLTDLLRDLDDSGDSEDVHDDEFGGDSPSWPSFEEDLRETEVQPQTPLVEPIVNAVGISSEMEKRDDIGTEVQAHAHETVRKEKPSPEVIMLDSDSDGDDHDELVMFDHVDETSQLMNTVKSEPGGSRQVPNGSSHLANAVMQEPGGLRQVPNGSSQVENPVQVEHGSTRQVPNGSLQVENSVKVEHGSTRQVPNGSLQVENSVKVEHGSTRHVLHSMQAPGFQAGTMQNILTQHLQQQQQQQQQLQLPQPQLQPQPQLPPGTMWQVRIVNGKLEPYIAINPVIPQNAVRMPMSPFGGNLMHPEIRQAYNLPSTYPSGCSSSFAPNNGYAQEVTSSGEQAGRSHGLNPPTTSAIVPSSGEQAGPSHGRNLFTTSAAVPSSGEQAGPSRRWNPSSTSAGLSSADQARPSHGRNPSPTAAGLSSSADQAGPSHAWNPPNTSAVVPFYNGASKAEPGLYDNTNLGPQNVPAHNQLAVVKPCYDSTVSTPRLGVARAMQNYDYYITKAKNDRAREALARTEATPNEFVKEGNRRGLECRPDIVAYNEMKKECEDVNPGITVGDLPGVEVGDRFTYRHQMAVVGLHRLPNVGIDYGYPPPDMIPTATAIVLMPKAGYVDDKDYGNTILYTGQGGRKKRNQAAPFVCDQELKKGNLALAKNWERKLPVRVIRGHSVLGNSGPGVLGYTYDGLYMITNYEFSMGMNGFNVYKYSLERLEGQPPIPPCIGGCTAHEWNTARGALGALPLQVMDPPPVEEDVKQLCM